MTNPVDDDGARARRRALAEAAGWLGIGLVNAPFVARLTSATGAGERALHHLVDLGQFALLAALAALAAAVAELVVRRFALPRAVRLAAAALLITPLAAWALREDLAGFLDRRQLPAWLPLRALVGLALSGAYVGFTALLELSAKRVVNWALVPAGLALVGVVNLALPPDYPGLHFFMLACAARALSHGAERALSRSFGKRVELGALATLLAAAVATLTLRPPVSVWRRLFDVPASVAPHLLGSLLAPSRRVRSSWVPTEHAAWFQDRSKLPARPPYEKRLAPANAIVVFLTIDALRADVAHAREHDAVLPALARLRDRSIRFVRARSPSPSTLTTAMAVFSGKYYSQTYWTKSGNSVMPTEDRSARWPELLSKRGVRTVHAVALRGLSKKTGVGRGFERERQTKRDYGRARDVMNIVLKEVKELGARPGVVYAHFVDPHAPYNLAGKHGSDFERYLREVALVDRELARLEKLASKGDLRERLVLVVSADHGEAFGEHGMRFHARSVYEELLRVPLYVALPGKEPRDVAEPVSLVDLGPTLLDLYGLPTPGDFMGESLVPLLAGETRRLSRPLVADSGRRLQALIFPDEVKAIRDLVHHTLEVYDLRRDPGELENLVDDPEFPAERYGAALEEFFDIHTLRRRGWEPPWRKF